MCCKKNKKGEKTHDVIASNIFCMRKGSRLLRTIKCLGKLLRISYMEHKTNDWVRSKIGFLVGPQEPLLATVKRRKLAWLRHVTPHDSLSKSTLPDT